jgi:putative FmdB family regulatory protein
MPVYTYRCHNCGNEFDHTQKFTDPMLTRCEACGQETLRKVFTPVGIVFKGKGFYSTDHKSPSGGKRSAGYSDEKSGESSESKATETTPAASTAAAASTSSTTSTTSTESSKTKSDSGESR